ncbi:MAG: hypothetical protein AAGG01_21375 [Planctomycetota bacterium]
MQPDDLCAAALTPAKTLRAVSESVPPRDPVPTSKAAWAAEDIL